MCVNYVIAVSLSGLLAKERTIICYTKFIRFFLFFLS